MTSLVALRLSVITGEMGIPKSCCEAETRMSNIMASIYTTNASAFNFCAWMQNQERDSGISSSKCMKTLLSRPLVGYEETKIEKS